MFIFYFANLPPKKKWIMEKLQKISTYIPHSKKIGYETGPEIAETALS